MSRKIQRDSYNIGEYLHRDRWSSYYTQLEEIVALKQNSVLEIGVGTNILGVILKEITSMKYKNLDFDESLSPDIIADILDVNLSETGRYDIVCAFQVLEHLPFDQLDVALMNMSQMSNKYVLISLPEHLPTFRFLLQFPGKVIKCLCKIPFYNRKHIVNKEHYWEVGKKDTTRKRVLTVMKKRFIVKKTFVHFSNPYHHFYILEKK